MRDHIYAGLVLGGSFGAIIAAVFAVAGLLAGPTLVMRGITIHAFEMAALYLFGGVAGGVVWGTSFRPGRGPMGHAAAGIATAAPFAAGLPFIMRRTIAVGHGVVSSAIFAIVLGTVVGQISASIFSEDS